MNKETFVPIVKASIKNLLGMQKVKYTTTGGTINSRYCYAVWLRHLMYYASVKNNELPVTVAELGPGDSLGTGLSALLSGCRKYIALDVVKYWDIDRNLKIFDELVELFKNRTAIPDQAEFLALRPRLDNYSFPAHILTEERLKESLSPARIEKIREAIKGLGQENNEFIAFYIPWNDQKIIQPSTIDFVFSQAVLGCVNDLENTYSSINKWLKPGGIMSHQVDFAVHTLTKSWNGHWTFSDREWKLITNGRPYLTNREPYKRHIGLIENLGLSILKTIPVKPEGTVDRKLLAGKFKLLDEEDFRTKGMYALAKKQ